MNKHEKKFLEKSSPISLHIKDNGLNIELIRGGMFAHSTWFPDAHNYRIDLIVTNTTKNPLEFLPTDKIIQTVDNKQFKSSYEGTLSSGTILPNSIVEGSILFNIKDDVDFKEVKFITLDDFIFDLVNNDAYTTEQLREKNYEKNVINVNESLTNGNFEITLIKIGPYTIEEYSDLVDGFRADFVVENKGSKEEHIPDDIILLDHKGNQFEKSSESNWSSKTIHPKVRYNGCAFFKGYLADSSKITIIITKSHSPENYTWSWDVDLVQ